MIRKDDLPSMARDVVAVVDYWPGVENAETEVMLRLKLALSVNGVGMVSIDRHGFLVDDPTAHIDDIDYVVFVLSLHFDTAAAWNKYTFFAMWNPLDFYFQWGYRDKSNNIVSADNFLSCGSSIVDEHIRRLLNGVKREPNGSFCALYHGVPGPLRNTGIGRNKLFYCGINWEALSGNGGRHHDVLMRLEKKGILDIYGPDVFQGVRVWAGFESYRGPIPFDGISLVKKVSDSGIGLVLSSAAHIKSEIMSNRLFECIAAGVPIICDKHPFAIKNFGDCLLYVDSELPADVVAGQIEEHVNWISNNVENALDMAAKAQKIYMEKFSLEGRLRDVLDYFHSEKHKLLSENTRFNYSPIFLAEKCSGDFLSKFARYVSQTKSRGFKSYVLVSDRASEESVFSLTRVDESAVVIKYFEHKSDFLVTHSSMMDALKIALEKIPSDNFVNIVLPWEVPCWSRILKVMGKVRNFDSVEYIETGFSVLHSSESRSALKAQFVPVVDFKFLFDANSSFAMSSFLFKSKSINPSVFYLIRHTPSFWYRFIALQLKQKNQGVETGVLAASVDFDRYSKKYRPDDINKLMCEIEFATDYFGKNFIAQIMGSDANNSRNQPSVDDVINEITGDRARLLLGRLLLQFKLPKYVKNFGERLWNRGKI